MTVAGNMKFQFHMKNGKIHEFTIPDGVKVQRALVWTSKENEKEMTKVIIIPDDVESIDVVEAETTWSWSPHCSARATMMSRIEQGNKETYLSVRLSTFL